MSSTTPSFNDLAQIMRSALKGELQNVLQVAREHGAQEMHEMLSYQLGWTGENAGPRAQGKQIRPLLTLLTAQASGGVWQNALPAAAAVELVHNFSLIHDDIEDDSSLRRGRPTVWKKWGIPQAINTGDAMLTLANQAALRLEETTSLPITLQASKILHHTCLRLTQGQHLDMGYETLPKVTVEEYWQMVEGKTASLIAASCELGALCAKVSKEIQSHYREFGFKLGLAFQAQDDLLGIWGKTEISGKSNTGDLITRKKTLPILYGLTKNKAFAKRWKAGPFTAEEIPVIAKLLEGEGALGYTQKAADKLTSQALTALKQGNPQGEAGKALHELAHKLLGRKG